MATLPGSSRLGCRGNTGARRRRRSPGSRGPARSRGRAGKRTTDARCTWTAADEAGRGSEPRSRPCPVTHTLRRENETETNYVDCDLFRRQGGKDGTAKTAVADGMVGEGCVEDREI